MASAREGRKSGQPVPLPAVVGLEDQVLSDLGSPVADDESKPGELVLYEDSLDAPLRRDRSMHQLPRVAVSYSQRCSECGGQCASGCSQSCSSCRDVVKKKWKKIDAKMRWLSDQLWPGPLGAALNMSTSIPKRIDIVMWGYNDPEKPDEYYYPTFKRYLPVIKISLIAVGGASGFYILCRNKSKQALKGALRGLQTGCALSIILEQSIFNEVWRDEKQIPDEVFFPTIFTVSIGAGVVAAYRSGRNKANQVALKQICAVSCGDRAFWALDVITRGLFYAATLSIPALLRFDQEYSDDRNLAFQRAWEYAGIGGVAISFGQSCVLDPATPDGPYVEMAALSAFCYEIVQQLMEMDDSAQMASEIVLWGVIAAISFYMMCMRRNLEQARDQRQYRALSGDDAPAPSRRNPYAGEDSKGHFRRGGALISDPSRAVAVRMAAPTPVEIRNAITVPM